MDLVRRALVLRRAKKIGVLYAEEGQYWIAESEFDPYGSRVWCPLERLRGIVEAAELELRKGPDSCVGVRGSIVLAG